MGRSRELAELAAAYDSGGALGWRNRIINGACQVAQRGNVTFNTQGAFIYGGVDRFVNAVSGATTWSGSIFQADIGNGRRAQQIQFTNTGTAVLQMGQRIESRNVFDMVGGKATFSGIVYHDFGADQVFTVRAFYPSATDTFGNGAEIVITTTTVNVVSGVETPFELTFDVPSQGSRGLLVEVISNITAKTSKSVLTWDWQLEKGAERTPFERRPHSVELALCQRYLPVTYKTGTTSLGGLGQAATGALAIILIPFSVTPRVPPTGITLGSAANTYSTSAASGGMTTLTSLVIDATTTSSLGVLQAAVASGLSVGQATYLFLGGNIYWTGCEL